MSTPLVSVVIAVKDAERTIARCLESVLAMGYPRIEVIVVDDGSRDNTPRILQDYSSRIRLITNASCTGPSQARNSACAIAQGEYVAFTDGDCIVEKKWAAELLFGFREETIAGVGGRQKVPDDETAFGRKVSLFMEKTSGVTEYAHKKAEPGRYVSHNPSCCSMYKKGVFLDAGGFLPGLWPGEDVELDFRIMRKGYKLYFNPAAAVYHYRPASPRGFARMMYRYGMVQAWLVRRYGVFRKVQVVSFAVLSVLALGIMAAAYGQMAVYLFLICICMAAALAIFRIEPGMLGLLVLAFLHWNLGFLKGFLFSSNPIKKRY